MQTARPEQIALLATRGQRLGLTIAPQDAWHDLYGDQMLRMELPHRVCSTDDVPHVAALALSVAIYGQPATPLPSRWTYGPSARRLVDRAPASSLEAPFLRIERMAQPVQAIIAPPPTITIEVFRAALRGATHPYAGDIAGVLWVSLDALRALVTGVRVSEFVARDDVTAEIPSGVRLSDEGLLYLPSEAGERYLLRIAAKYGESALFTLSDTRQ